MTLKIEEGDKINIIMLLGLVLIVISGILVAFYVITHDINKCTSNPINYYAKNIMKNAEPFDLVKNSTYLKLNFYITSRDMIPVKSLNFSLV